MKKIWMLMVVLHTIGYVYGQNDSKHCFGVQSLLGSCNYHGYQYRSAGFSRSDYEGTNYYGLGLCYRYRYSEKNELCFGITTTFNNMIENHTSWGSSTSSHNVTAVMFSFPVQFKQNFQKYFFIGGGPCLNIHPNMVLKEKWSIGLEANVGIEYTFKSGLIVSLSPRVQLNWLNISGYMNAIDIDMDALSQIGVNVGVGYKFGRK